MIAPETVVAFLLSLSDESCPATLIRPSRYQPAVSFYLARKIQLLHTGRSFLKPTLSAVDARRDQLQWLATKVAEQISTLRREGLGGFARRLRRCFVRR